MIKTSNRSGEIMAGGAGCTFKAEVCLRFGVVCLEVLKKMKKTTLA